MGRGPRRGDRPLKRRVGVLSPKKTLVVFCEGERTEPEYLLALKRQPVVRDVAAVEIRVEKGQGGCVPRTLVSRAADARAKAVDEDDEIDEFWCVFDVEWPRNHPELKEAIKDAGREGIRVAVSNPCFEVWLVLHFQDYGAWLDNDDACDLRRSLDGSSDKGLAPGKYMPLVADAARRAASLDERHLRDGTRFPHNNPSSGMHLLIASVLPPDT